MGHGKRFFLHPFDLFLGQKATDNVGDGGAETVQQVVALPVVTEGDLADDGGHEQHGPAFLVPVEYVQVLLVPQLQFVEVAGKIDLVGLNVAVRVLQQGLLHVVAGIQSVQQQVLFVGFGQRRVLRTEQGLNSTVHHFQDGRIGQHGLALLGRLHQQLFGDVQHVAGQWCSVGRCKGWFYGFVWWW